MDAKITKKRLGHMLSYDWIKIIAVALVAIFVWSLVLTMTATRITVTQRFVIMNYLGANRSTGFDRYYDMQGKDFSYEIIEMDEVSLADRRDQIGSYLEAQFAIGEVDVMFAPNVPDPQRTVKEKDENGNVISTKTTSYMAEFLNTSYSKYVAQLDGDDGYFDDMKNYLSRFYECTETEKTFGDVTLTVAAFDETTLDKAEVESAFLARTEKNKDKRFKTDEEKAQGIQDEIARIESYCAAYEKFFSYLENGYITFTVSTVTRNKIEHTGAYSLNLCPDENLMGTLKQDVYYYETVTNEDGTESSIKTAKDMNLLFLELDELDHDFKYEDVIFVNKVIETHCTALNATE